uniref:alpha/beta fold hydrolase n=1 Tax=Agathobacter sp. TaxID=2021311 RepID=UPI0040577C0E
MKKSTKRFLFLSGTAITGIYAYNKFISTTATQKQLLSDEEGDYYPWKYGKIYYTKKGTGSPLLLLHDAHPTASSAEWSKIQHRLMKHHTVYTLDLLGCGLSEKPCIEYTNFLYVQLISSFVKDVIGEKTAVAASNFTTSFVIMANHIDSHLFSELILINPVSLHKLNDIPDKTSKTKKCLMEVPFIGTFIYNILTTPKNIDNRFRKNYYMRSEMISSKLEDIYYEAAHTDGSNGRYLYSSRIGNYLNNQISHAVKKLETRTLIIGSENLPHSKHILENYHRINPGLNIMHVPNTNYNPHMEIPEKITSIIEDFLNKN